MLAKEVPDDTSRSNYMMYGDSLHSAYTMLDYRQGTVHSHKFARDCGVDKLATFCHTRGTSDYINSVSVFVWVGCLLALNASAVRSVPLAQQCVVKSAAALLHTKFLEMAFEILIVQYCTVVFFKLDVNY